MGNSKENLQRTSADGAGEHLPDSPGSPSPQQGAVGSILEKYPWAKRMKAALDGNIGGSSTNGPRKFSGESGSEPVHAGSGSGFFGTRTQEDKRNLGGATVEEPSASAPILAPGQPFYGLLNLVQDPATSYSHGLAMMVGRVGIPEIYRAFKARGWGKEAATEKSWLSSALLGRRYEMGRPRSEG